MKQFKKDFIAFATTSHALTPVYNDNGSVSYFTFDYYIDYREENTVSDMINKYPDITNETIYSIMECIHDNLIDCDYHFINDLLNDFLEEYPQYDDLIDYHDVIDTVDIYGNSSDYENLIYNTYINVNILLNTNDDKDLEYSNNNSSAIIDALHNENYTDYMDLIHDSSIKTLLNSQGIHEQVFYQYITDGSEKSNKFLDSLYNELLNGYKHEAVTFFTKMTVSDYLKLKESKAFRLPKNIDCGLVDFICGAGSILNIELQSDIILNCDHVSIEIDGGYNYGIMDIYGLVGYNESDIKIIEEGNVLNE